MKWNYILIVLTALSALFGAWLQLKNKDLHVSYFYVILGLIFAYATIDLLRTRRDDMDMENKHIEVIEGIQSLKSNDNIPDKVFPGYALMFLLKIDESTENRRKFIVDIGQESDRNRVSIYLDRKDNLVFRIFDEEAEPHLIKVPKKIHTFQLGTYYHFYCDYGLTPKYSFMRLFINNREFGKNLFVEKLNMPEKLDNNQVKIGSDLFGKNNSKFTVQMFAASHNTLDSEKRSNFIGAIEDYLEKLVE